MERLWDDSDKRKGKGSVMRNIAVIANNVKWLYSGRFKNLLNHAKGLAQDLIIVNSDIDLDETKSKYDKVRIFSDYEEIEKSLKTGQYDYLLFDDRDVNNLKNLLYKGILYVYPIRGLWGIGGLPIKNVDQLSSKVRYIAERIALNRVILNSYVRNISSSKIILTQSYTSSGILRYYYGIEPDFISFNPVDKTVFKPKLTSKQKLTSDEVMLFLGTGYGDTNLSLLPKIAEILHAQGLKANVIGNSKRLKYIQRCEFEYFKDVKDEILSDIYSRSRFTIAPQIDEPISYVAIESISTGTPILTTFPDESIDNGANGYFSSSMNFIGLLEKVIEKFRMEETYNELYRKCLEISTNFDLKNVGKRLLNYLDVKLDAPS